MRHFAKAQRGFTLIEMSIVLVIIGLIIGGILKGQELIESSRQKNAFSQVDRVRASVTTFVDRYRALPGDFLNAGNALIASGVGNEDGVVGVRAVDLAAILATNGTTGENKTFFNQLAASDLLGGISVIAPATDAPGFAGGAVPSPLPQSAFPASGLMVVYGVHQGGVTVQTSAFNWLRMSKFAGAITGTEAIVSPQRAFQMDQKYDDGLPMTGALRSQGLNADCGTVGGDTPYVAATTEVRCGLLFQLN